MKITCLDKQVGQFLKASFYRIPRFQRPYSWDRTNIEEFWNDAVVENEAQYFIGNFVVYEDKTAMGVVDGQQRLTSFTRLACNAPGAAKKRTYVCTVATSPVTNSIPGVANPALRVPSTASEISSSEGIR
jgi:hypothetical protein